ncbi:probable receptor-like protein kinase At5g20050 [Juglans microcarpa x Juglans regia]|uniref:probable receptor-like protein kinase At5g20050 n=1 Tax=Juglans microcarpa x Juglans regia TaxID=2249226 RepID=UPI001B7F4426|nr:probable receptor-like protein kinase At5g20050 [Juglans microcarpa x Juglans regia]XP_041006158.1 probable receptor-like protein kinase At5g20050 [Juglans microcarpa x Juglans regia]XP_041006159.1 probable receptor-like protein kinase At5g20050 [Juglans microcarpa x Juglans regia]XP_041006160.1 probable receptor-like protein kinase At5g20050 [Juglans microcarpa x Juglans regia]
MEDKKANIIAVATVITVIVFIVVARVSLKLSKTFFLICGAGIAVILAVLAYLIIRRHYNRRRKFLESRLVSEGRELRIEYSFLRKVAGVPSKFRYRELEEATDNFQSLLGQGASATVYKGILNDGTAVAVKRINGEEHGEKEFRSEVSAIASVQHVNLVHLLGYCCNPGGPRFLVYEFIPNGSLDYWIFPRRESRNRRGGCLSWALRYKVAIDVAKALSYLHHDCRSRVLHLDVKPENILLDENYRAIVADFGLSKLMGKDQSRVVTTIRGTRGYLAPEWLLEQGISEKSDIYSYGMVLLEMIGGCRNVCLIETSTGNRSERRWRYFPKIVNQKIREGTLMEVVDRRLAEGGGGGGAIDEREVRRLAYVALWCIQERAGMRPSMARVVEMLEGLVAVDEPPDTRMIVVDLLAIDDDQHESDARNGPQVAAMAAPRLVDSNNLPISSANSFAMSILSPR